jgi:RecG-like helicase
LKEELRTTSRYVGILASNGIQTLKDFFNNFPRAYEDRSHIRPLNQLLFDEKGRTATKGMIIQKKMFRRG